MTDFKNFILDARKRSGLSQVKYAALLGVVDNTFANWERGDTTPAEERQTEIVAKIEELERAGPTPADPAVIGDVEFNEKPADPPADPAVSISSASEEEPKMNKPALPEPPAALPPPSPAPVQPAAFPKAWPDSWGIRRA